MKKTISIGDEDALGSLVTKIAPVMAAPMVVYLIGDLGVGKTTFTRFLLRHLGCPGLVKSPTYTLIESYEATAYPVQHLDLYRISDPEELVYLGLDELLEVPSLALIEWPQQGGECLPPPDLSINFEFSPVGRTLTFTAHHASAAAIIGAL